jgi:hypothetical protein
MTMASLSGSNKARDLFEDGMVAICACCRNKSAVRLRHGVRAINQRGERTVAQFTGFLCDGCLAATERIGSAAYQWLLKQLSDTRA